MERDPTCMLSCQRTHIVDLCSSTDRAMNRTLVGEGFV
jgi:hypothetical protein